MNARQQLTAAGALVFVLGCAVHSLAQAQVTDQQHGTVIGDVVMYVSPDTGAAQVARPSRGRDTWLMGRSNIDGKPWAHIMVTMSQDALKAPQTITGWTDGRLVITSATPNGDQIIYGEAVEAERQSETGRKHADEDAMRLYYRLFEYFPNSPLAGESLWRAADLRWQLEKSGIFARPSSFESSPDNREQLEEDTMHEVIKKFPHTRWADLAAYDLLDNKICGGWKGETHCPERETDLYEHYAHEHPQSPKAPEALYKAAWRQAALVDMYKAGRQQDKSEKARRRAMAIVQEISAKYPEGDWKPRAAQLAFALQQGLEVYTDAKSEAGK
jgi:hypothetical protein